MKKLVLATLFFVINIFSNPVFAGIVPVSSDGKMFSLAPMLEIVTPTVVNISVTTSSPVNKNPLFNDPFFRQFFKFQRHAPRQSAGSGVIIDAKNGIIVTNHHVIRNAQEVKVTLKDRREFTAKLIGVDPKTDIAVISIPPKKLSAIKLGDSDNVEVGDFVAAIGNPFAIGQTVTSGIVSALGRSGLNVRNFEDFIQTDAAINPGNSGGALVNLRGQLIGINSTIISPAGASVGIGFAIPVNMMSAIVSQIRKNGKVQRGVFGVEVQDLTPTLSESFGIKSTAGAIIVKVKKNSIAESIGLVHSDVVVELDGRKILSSNHLRSQLALIPQGNKFKLKVFRQGRAKIINAKMINPRKKTISKKKSQNKSSAKNVNLGIIFADSEKGVIVESIAKNGLAINWGLQIGDIVLEINNKKIKSTQDIPVINPQVINFTLKRGRAVIRIYRR